MTEPTLTDASALGASVSTDRRQALRGGARYGKPRTGHAEESGDSANATGRCLNCGQSVTRKFAQVFGDNDDLVYGCFECLTVTAVKRGAARAPDAETHSYG